MKYGSFPEPFLSQSETDSNRWRKQYVSLVLIDDVRQIGDVKDISSMQLLIELLRKRVGSPLSLNSIAGDLEVSTNTVKRYIELLEQMYVVFRVNPYHKNIARAILKEPKIYFYDIGLVIGDDGVRFENLMALHLLKHLHFLEDTKGVETKLHYIRDRQRHEVDFYYCEKEEDEGTLLEVKLTKNKPDRNLIYFHERLGKKATQVVLNIQRELQYGNIKIVPAATFLNFLAC